MEPLLRSNTTTKNSARLMGLSACSSHPSFELQRLHTSSLLFLPGHAQIVLYKTCTSILGFFEALSALSSQPAWYPHCLLQSNQKRTHASPDASLNDALPKRVSIRSAGKHGATGSACRRRSPPCRLVARVHTAARRNLRTQDRPTASGVGPQTVGNYAKQDEVAHASAAAIDTLRSQGRRQRAFRGIRTWGGAGAADCAKETDSGYRQPAQAVAGPDKRLRTAVHSHTLAQLSPSRRMQCRIGSCAGSKYVHVLGLLQLETDLVSWKSLTPPEDGDWQRAKTIGPDKAKVQQGEAARHLVVPWVSEAALGALQPRLVSVVDMDSLPAGHCTRRAADGRPGHLRR